MFAEGNVAKSVVSLFLALLLATVMAGTAEAQVRYVDQYPGATAGAKLAACVADLPKGGTCDARNLSGAQVIDETIRLSSGVTLLLPPPAAANFRVLIDSKSCPDLAHLAPCAAFTVNNASDVTILSGQLTLSTVNASAVVYSGVVSNLCINGMTVAGSGRVSDGQQGFWNYSGQTLINLRILNNTISGVILGISINADLGGSIKGFLISGNHLSNIVGILPGQGYGIHHANGSGISSDGRILNNYIQGAQRHSIYQAKGSGVEITGNRIQDHRRAVTPSGQERPAIIVSRSQNITVSGNIIENSLGGALAVDTDTASYPLHNVVLANNVIWTARDFYPVTIGSSNPASDSFPTDVTLVGNHIYQDAAADNTFGGSIVQIFSGKRIQIANNYLGLMNARSTGASVIQIRGSQESSMTANYTDEISIKGNYLYGTSGTSSVYGIELYTTAASSGIHAYFSGNQVNVTADAFLCDAAQTDPNIVVTGMPLSGLNP